jgi:hypothetical protein
MRLKRGSESSAWHRDLEAADSIDLLPRNRDAS